MSNMDRMNEVTPKAGLVYSEGGMLTGVLCKPKVMPIKSMTLEKIEEMEQKILEEFNKAAK